MSQNENHELNIYELTNKTTGHRHFSVSDNAQDACKQAGWLIGDCVIRLLKPLVKPTKEGHYKPMVWMPCQVCPYQYCECTKPANDECPARDCTPDLDEWLKHVARAHLCQYIGEPLTHLDYNKRRKWTSYEHVIKTINPQPSPTNPNG